MSEETKVYSNVRKTGRCFNGAERDGGRIIHVIEGGRPNGDWFGKTLCKTDAGLRGNGWSNTDREPTCAKCIKVLNKLLLKETK